MGGTAILGGAAACLCLGAVNLLATPTVSSVAAASAFSHSRRGDNVAVSTRLATAPCRGANAPASSASASQMAAAVDCLVNQERRRFGLPPMAVARQLNRSAQRWTERMVARGIFTHGGDAAFTRRLRDAGFRWSSAGENIATGYLTPRQAVAAWMASPDHCRNILEPGFREMGTGVNPAPVSNFASGGATWTQDFGLMAGQAPLSDDHAPQHGCPYPARPKS